MATVTIRKYENRRLYDTSASRYINLDDLAAMVRNGTEIKVVDAKSGEDLTRVTLTQIIVEEAKDQPGGLPLELLRQLIMASDKVRREFMSWYLKSSFDSYQNLQNAVQSGLAQVGSAAMSPLESLGKFLHVTPASKPTADSGELEELRKRVSELETALKRTRAKPTAKRRASVKRRKVPKSSSK